MEFCRPRPPGSTGFINTASNLNDRGTSGNGPSFFAAAEDGQDVCVTDAADESSVCLVGDMKTLVVKDDVVDATGSEEAKGSAAKDPAVDQVRHFVSETLGLGCEVS